MESTDIFNRVFTKFKADFPQDWPTYVRKATRNIKAMQRLHKLNSDALGMREAVALCLKLGDNAATAAAYVVASGIITRLHDLESEHISIEQRALRIEEQQQILKNTADFTDEDKEELNAYYTHCLAKVTAITDRVMQEAIALTLSLGITEPTPPPVNTLPTYTHHHSSRLGGRGGAVSA